MKVQLEKLWDKQYRNGKLNEVIEMCNLLGVQTDKARVNIIAENGESLEGCFYAPPAVYHPALNFELEERVYNLKTFVLPSWVSFWSVPMNTVLNVEKLVFYKNYSWDSLKVNINKAIAYDASLISDFCNFFGDAEVTFRCSYDDLYEYGDEFETLIYEKGIKKVNIELSWESMKDSYVDILYGRLNLSGKNLKHVTAVSISDRLCYRVEYTNDGYDSEELEIGYSEDNINILKQINNMLMDKMIQKFKSKKYNLSVRWVDKLEEEYADIKDF